MHSQHRRTLQALFAHPVQRGLPIAAVAELCRALGAEVSQLEGNRLKLRWPEGEETWLHCGSGKGSSCLSADALHRLRRVLEQQGISADQPEPRRKAARGDQSHRLVVRLDHRHCDLFHLRTSDGQTDVEHAVLRPHGLWGSGERLSHRHDRDIAGQRAPLDHDYLQRIAQAIANADTVLLVGHGHGRSSLAAEFRQHLKQHQPTLLARVRDLHIDDTGLSDEGLLALAREQFGNLPHRHRLRIPGQEIREAP